MQEIIGYILFVLIGLTLGLIGGGGSTLAVPVLVYLLGYSIDDATGCSLFIVGITSLVGGLTFIKRGDIALEALYLFALPSLATVFCTRKFILPLIPDTFFSLGNFVATKQFVIMAFFAALILASSWSMIRKRKNTGRSDLMWGEFYRSPIHIPFVIILGIAVGFLSGIVGVGGGFMIIPVLVLFLRIPMKQAIGTSLAIIAINSLIGFTGSLGNMQVDWMFLAIVSVLASAGIFAGSYLARYIPGKKLKPAFGWFTLFVGIFILSRELFFKTKT
jgi:uncharacterized protein